jgi:hypothetical protein
MEKWLKKFQVGAAQLTLSGNITTEDDTGRRTYYDAGLFWDPWGCETGRTVAAKNRISIQGDPGPKVSIMVFAASLKDRKVLGELGPTFTNAGKKIWVWEYEIPLVVFIDGERDAENWTISHSRMFSDRVVFDLAKNRLQLDATTDVQQSTDGDNGDGELDEETKNLIAGSQLGHGIEKSDKRPKRRTEAQIS